MELLAGAEIRDFRIRGHYFNQRSLALRKTLHSSKKDRPDRVWPGYSPPVVEFELEDGVPRSIRVSDADVAALCNDDPERARQHLALILNARSGDVSAVRELCRTAQHDLKSPRMEPTETEYVVPFTSCQPHTDQEISQKGRVLLKLSQMGYPVPDFVVLTSQAYVDRTSRFEECMAEAIQQLEILTAQGAEELQPPLVFAIRCATATYVPGLMDTYLNGGVTESVLPRLERMYGTLAAQKMFLNNLRNLCRCLGSRGQVALVDAVRSDLPPSQVLRLIEQLSGVIRKADPVLLQDPLAQAIFLSKAAYKDFEENQDLLLTLTRGTAHYPSLIFQKMICTVRHENAYAGVISSRHTQTGSGIELQTAHNIFGEEMMTGTAEIESTVFDDREAIKARFPAVYHFTPHLADLEQEFESPVTIEFAVEATEKYQWFALLQLNQAGMAGRAAITSVIDMHKAGIISRQRVTELIRPYHIKQLTSDTIDQEDFSLLHSFCNGVAVLPRSAVSARAYFSGDDALRAKSQGEKVCLCKQTFVPTDSVVMREMDAILSLTSAAVHVVTICQSLGIPAILSLEKNGVKLLPNRGLVNTAGIEIKEGDWVTISSRRHTVFEGKAKFQPARLLRYMRGEPVAMDEEEKKVFASIAYAYRYYQQLTKGLAVDQISTLSEVVRLVNFDLRGESEQARELVNGWFDHRETPYMEEVLKSDIGDHLGQSNVFESLTLDRKIRFFKLALAKCARERISGYEAGAFMLGRFLCTRYPAAFWKCFTPAEVGMLVNEWVLFEKYMQLLHNVGERKVLLARKQILKDGLEQLSLHPGNVQSLITLKLSRIPLGEVHDSLPDWSDPQAKRVLEILQQPYGSFYNYKAAWSLGQLEKICREENLSVPGEGET